MVVGFWKQRAGIDGRATASEYEILGIGGCWFGCSRPPTGCEIAWQRDWFDLGSTAHTFLADRRLREGAAAAARPDVRWTGRRSPVTTASRPALDVWPPVVGMMTRASTAAADRRQARRGQRRRRRTRSSTRPPASRSASAPDATADDVDAAIAAARRAFDETDWSTDLALRVRCLRQLHQALVDHGEEMRALTTAEVGRAGVPDRRPAVRRAGRGTGLDGRPRRGLRVGDRPRGGRADGHPHPAHGPARGGRRGRRDHAVELPQPDQPGQGRPRAGSPATPSCSSPRRTRPWVAAELGRLATEHTDLPPGVLNVVTPRDNDVAAVLATDPRVDLVSLHRLHRHRAGRSWPPRRRR